MNYRHIYHAGNFADVVKHLVLISLLNNLCKKDTPYYVLDCFAGKGEYNLNSELSLKTNEAQDGVKKILACKKTAPALLEEYKKIITIYGADFNIYPGSPAIISNFLREHDKADFCELHPEDFLSLKKNMRNSPHTSCHNIDAYLSLNSLLPPKQKRGLIFMDPAFEVVDEFEKIVQGITVALKKFSGATYMIWYPIKDYKKVREFYKSLLTLKKELLKIEFSLTKIHTNLTSIGIIIINPPYISDVINENLEFIKTNIYNGDANYSVGLLPAT